MNEWISAQDKMPEFEQEVLVWLYDQYHIGYLNKDLTSQELRWHFEDFCLEGDEIGDVKAWMYLPMPYCD